MPEAAASAHSIIYTSQSQSQAASLEREYLRSDEDKLTRMKTWGVPYFNRIEKVLDADHMPKELEFLAVIESELKSSATSRVGAKGMWQFMPETARLYGLRVNGEVDDRTDVEKSTRAAARYLQDLYDELHDWLLVIAAYDGGTAAIHYAIRKAGSRNFWDLQYYLPAESRIHVKRFLATNFFMDPSDAQMPMPKPDAIQDATSVSQAPPVRISEMAVKPISGHYLAAAIAKHLGMTLAEFMSLNPEFDQTISGPSGSYELRLPKDKMQVFEAAQPVILAESVRALLNEDDEDPRH